MSNPPPQSYIYEVAISYAGEDRPAAQALATALHARNISIFYDEHSKAKLWGKDLYTFLTDLYQNRARFCVIFLSHHYADKLWPKHELRAAQARAFGESQEYILPIRLDDTEIPTILPTIGYLSWPPENADSVAEALLQKLGRFDEPSKPKETAADAAVEVRGQDVVSLDPNTEIPVPRRTAELARKTAALEPPSVIKPASAPRRNWKLWGGSAAGALLALLLARGLFLLTHQSQVRTVSPAHAPAAPTSLAPAVAVTPGTLILDAVPWGELVEIHDASGKPQAIGPQKDTPLVLSLPPGHYTATLRNPSFLQPVSISVDISTRASVPGVARFGEFSEKQFFTEMGW